MQQALINKGYKIIPVLFDNEAIEQAINENKAPANFINDNSQLLLFKDAATVILKENAKAPIMKLTKLMKAASLLQRFRPKFPTSSTNNSLNLKTGRLLKQLQIKNIPLLGN